jgi:acetoin utilization protein AcuC
MDDGTTAAKRPGMTTITGVRVYTGEALAAYHFGAEHPFGPRRYWAFMEEFQRRGLEARVQLGKPDTARRDEILLFHESRYVDLVQRASLSGHGYLDYGDTPAFPGVYDAAATVVGTVLRAVDAILADECDQCFIPIAGLHHARRDRAAGFCVFNDCGIAIEYLRNRYDIRRVAYVDIDAHHGDGVFYGFEDDPELCFVDFHEDGRYLYPGTGFVEETGIGAAKGTKLNLPMPPAAGDSEVRALWPKAEAFIEASRPEFILLQCGADSLGGDPITHLAYTEATHRYVAERLQGLAQRHCDGRMIAMGGGGYDLDNLAAAWCEVVESLVES